MQAGLLQEVLAHGRRDGTHIADMLHDGSNGDGHDGNDGRDEERSVQIVKHSQGGLLFAERQSDPCGLAQRREVHLAQRHGCQIAHHHTQQDRDNPDDTLAPHTGKNHRYQRHNSQWPVGGAVLNSATREHQSNGDNHRTRDQRRKEAQHILDAKRLDKTCHHEIAQSGKEHANAGIIQGQRLAHALFYAQRLHRHVAAQKGKRRAKEGRHLQLADKMEYQCADTCKQQC